MSPIQSYISNLLDTYLSAFNHGDYPCATISSHSIKIYTTRQDFIDTITSAVSRLRECGWDHSEWGAAKKIVVLEGDGLVIASCPCRRVREDGSAVEEFTASYTFRRTEGEEWLIVAVHHLPYGNLLDVTET
jgi:hypothetical protein